MPLVHLTDDVGRTGSHQCGYYLPKAIWQTYTPFPPEKGKNNEHFVKIIWQDGRETESCVKWYGKGTRSEYRLTRFGRDFPFLLSDNIGSLLVLVVASPATFLGYVLDSDDEISEMQAALGVEVIGSWALYDASAAPLPETEDACLDRNFRVFSEAINTFPSTTWFSEKSRAALLDCIDNFLRMKIDLQLVKFIETEYRLFQLIERRLSQNEISRLFKSIDDFLSTAARIMNRRKARAGRSLENHTEFILRNAGVPFEMRPNVDGKPDILIPGKAQYENLAYPSSRLIVIGVKTTCKDRWRQVLNEAKRIPHKHILTIQQGISKNQLEEMCRSNVSLIVPQPIQKQYPHGTGIEMLSLEEFVTYTRQRLA
ncbi:MAG: type II restriction endonuclease [Candidatus Aenigmarchaeota archaeon]|nr:type II restriction endonuclease [Candidatus Aenigmarchaeota archaeon]